MTARDALQRYFAARDWPAEEVEPGRFRFVAPVGDEACIVVVAAHEDFPGIVARALAPTPVPPGEREPVALELMAWNTTLLFGAYELDPESGRVGARASIEAPAGQLTDELVDGVVRATVALVRGYVVAVSGA